MGKNSTTYTSLKTKLTHVISSATDTEGKTTQNLVWHVFDVQHTFIYKPQIIEACGHRQCVRHCDFSGSVQSVII